MIEFLVGTLLINYGRSDPEWRFHAGYVATLLEGGAPMPSSKALGGLSRVAGQQLLTREQVIEWGRLQETALN